MNTRFQVTGAIVVLVVATTGMYLWLAAKAKRDAAAPAGAEISATVPGENAARMAAGGESTLAAADIGTAAADLSRAAAAPVPDPPRTRLGGELAIQWAQARTGRASERIEDERSQRAARDSIAFATPFEMQERFDSEPRNHQWAHIAELQVQQFLDTHPFRDVYGPLALECRATLCRIAAVGDGQALSAGGRGADWQVIMYELMHDPGFSSLFAEERVLVMTNNEHPGQVGFISWLRRNQPPGN